MEPALLPSLQSNCAASTPRPLQPLLGRQPQSAAICGHVAGRWPTQLPAPLLAAGPAGHFSPWGTAGNSAAVLGALAAVHLATARCGGGGRRTRRSSGLVRQAASFDVAAWRAGFFEAQDPKGGYYVMQDVDSIPPDLRGTLFRNGPGKFGIGQTNVCHQLDGDGFMLAVTFAGGGQVSVRHRLTQTQGLIRDVFEQSFTSKGLHGTPAQTGRMFGLSKLEVKNTANAGVLWWEDKLLALWPLGLPYLVDPGSLGTLIGDQDSGASSVGGVLEGNAGFGATPRVCTFTGRLLNLEQTPGTITTQVRFHEFSKWKPLFVVPRSISIPGYTYFSDFGATANWFIIARPPLTVDVLGATFGKTMTEVLSYDPQGQSELIFVSRSKKNKKEVSIPVDGFVCQEFVNAYELEDGNLVVDVVAAKQWDLGRSPADSELPLWEVEDPSKGPHTQLVRYEVDLKTKEWTKVILSKRHLATASVNPAMSGKRHGYVFCGVGHSDSGVGPIAGVAKINTASGTVDAWVPSSTQFASPPVFVPFPSGSKEDDGYLISVIFDGSVKRSDVVVFDARDVSSGPVCRFTLEEPLPHGLRSCWAEGLTFTPEDLKRKMILRRMFEDKATRWNSVNTSLSLFSNAPILFEKQGGRMR